MHQAPCTQPWNDKSVVVDAWREQLLSRRRLRRPRLGSYRMNDFVSRETNKSKTWTRRAQSFQTPAARFSYEEFSREDSQGGELLPLIEYWILLNFIELLNFDPRWLYDTFGGMAVSETGGSWKHQSHPITQFQSSDYCRFTPLCEWVQSKWQDWLKDW